MKPCLLNLRLLATLLSFGLLACPSLPAQQPPAMNSFSPTSGSVGTRVTIFGSGFSNQVSVRFSGASPAVAPIASTPGSVVVLVPAGAATGPIMVSTGFGSSTSRTAFVVASASTLRLSGNLAFGRVPVGLSSTRTLTMFNPGPSAVTVTNIVAPPGFRANFAGIVPAGQARTVSVTFTPTMYTTYRGTLFVGSDANVGTNGIAVSGTGVQRPTRAKTDFDANGDGRAELALFDSFSGNWYVKYAGSSTTNFASGAGTVVPWGWNGVQAVNGDFDGDGWSDFAFYDPIGGDWYIAFSTGGSIKYHLGWAGCLPVTGDFNGDTRTDIAVYYPSNGTWYIKYSGGGATTFANGGMTSYAWGWSQATPAPGDYDGDGRTDVAVYDQAAGDWYIQFSSGGSTKVHWGWIDAVPVPGDYNGDGRTDVAVYAANLGTWYIMYSGSSTDHFASGGSTRVEWGWSEAMPVPADYDGDGTTDIAVYNQAMGSWYILFSSDASTQVQWGRNAAEPIAGPQFSW